MRARRLSGLLVLAAGCSDITATDEGVASLLIEVPAPAEVEAGQTLDLRGVALGVRGDTLDLPVYWIALDTTISVDSVAGKLTGRTAGQTGRVIARAGSLYSAQVTFSVLFRADTLVRLSPAVVTLAPTDTSSAALAARLDRTGPTPGPVQGRRVVYQLVYPVFDSSDPRSVELVPGGLVHASTTSTLGTPLNQPRLRVVPGRERPDSAVVTLHAWRPGGAPIPGSGQRLTFYFPAP